MQIHVFYHVKISSSQSQGELHSTQELSKEAEHLVASMFLAQDFIYCSF